MFDRDFTSSEQYIHNGEKNRIIFYFCFALKNMTISFYESTHLLVVPKSFSYYYEHDFRVHHHCFFTNALSSPNHCGHIFDSSDISHLKIFSLDRR